MKYQGEHLAQFSAQISYALTQFEQQPFSLDKPINNIVICGLGGSGIAGRLVSNFVLDSCSIPISIVSDYHLPALATSQSLIICSSYSGNTEETLSCFQEATKLGAQCVVLTGGGKLEKLAQEHGCLIYKAQLGFQPRMALGYPLAYLLLIMDSLLDGVSFKTELLAELDNLKSRDSYLDTARQLFETYKEIAGQPVEILADSKTIATAVRFQQQLNENPKVSAFVHPMPEMCHNVIESFTDKTSHFYIILDSGNNSRNSIRFDFLESLLKEKGNLTQRISMPLESLKDLLTWNFVFDWYSLVCADHLNIVSSDIPNIIALKDTLSKS